MTVLTSSSHRAGQGVSQDHFGSLIHHMVLEITLGSHFRLRSHFSENSVKYNLGENRTHDTSFVGYIALYPLGRKETTHSSSSYDRASVWRRP